MYFKNLFEVEGYYQSSGNQEKRTWIVFLADKSDQLLDQLTSFCNKHDIQIIGGIFPGLLVKAEYIRTGLIVLEMNPSYTCKVLPHMMKSCPIPISNKTAMILADGLSPHFKVLMDTIYNKLGTRVKCFGGGAGYYDLEHRPCVFDNSGFYKDVAMVVITDNEATVNYRHGWDRLIGPFIANQTLDNTLLQIDGVSAAEFYKKLLAVYTHNNEIYDNPSYYFKAYPFGIDVGQTVDVVRDPLRINHKNEIQCVAGIPEGSNIYILHGDANTLLNASLEIAAISRKVADTYSEFRTILFDCITRAIYLQLDFQKEINNIQTIMQEPVYGALSIGEISSLENGQLEIHNKSTIIAVIKN